jgi:hypothetical protein
VLEAREANVFFLTEERDGLAQHMEAPHHLVRGRSSSSM